MVLKVYCGLILGGMSGWVSNEFWDVFIIVGCVYLWFLICFCGAN